MILVPREKSSPGGLPRETSSYLELVILLLIDHQEGGVQAEGEAPMIFLNNIFVFF